MAYFADSFGRSNESLFFRRIREAVKPLSLLDISITQQKDTVNCGIFTMINLRAIVNQLLIGNFPSISNIDSDYEFCQNFRIKILKQIEDNGLW